MKRMLACGLTIAIIGCGGSQSPPPPRSVEKGAYRTETEPANAKSVMEIREKAVEGEIVYVTGKIGGRAKPFIDGRAAFMIADMSLKSCDQIPGDSCATPWDYCCAPREELQKGTALIKVIDEKKNETATIDARELFGIKELDVVTLIGMARRDAQKNLTIELSQLYVRPPKEASKP